MAGASSPSEQDEGMNEINIVPFVDIALVLLIIFMVTTEFIRDDKEDTRLLPKNVPIELPRAASGDETNKSLLSIALNSTGDLFLNGERSTLEGIKTRVAELRQKGEKLEAFVAADERLTHGAVLTVVDTLRTLGIPDVGINTKPMEIE
jgi:biopolymer transport protein ExbD